MLLFDGLSAEGTIIAINSRYLLCRLFALSVDGCQIRAGNEVMMKDHFIL